MIFETLYLLFKADTKDLKKNTKEAQGLTDSLKKSFQGMSDASGSLDESFLKLTNSIGGLITAGLSVYGVFEGFKNALDFGVTLSSNARALGVNVTELNTWGNAVQHYGGSAETFSKSIQNLSEKTGLSFENSVKLLNWLQPAFSKLNKVQQFQQGSNIGLDSSLIQLLGSGNERFSELLGYQKQLRPLTEENAQAFLKFNDSLINSKQAITSVFTQILIKALPSLTKFLDVFTKFAVEIVNNDSALEGAFKGIAISLGILTAAFLALNPTIAIVAGLVTAVTALSTYFSTLDNANPDQKMDKLGNSAKRATEWFGSLKDIIDGIVFGIDKIDSAITRFSNFEKDKSASTPQLTRGAFAGLHTLLPSVLDNQGYAITRSDYSSINHNNLSYTAAPITVNVNSQNDSNKVFNQLVAYSNSQHNGAKQLSNQMASSKR